MGEVCEIPPEEHAENQRTELSTLLRHYNEARAQLADRDAEIERLRADLVWAVLHDAGLVAKDGKLVLDHDCGDVPVENTPESICRAVREARDGIS